MPYNFNRDGKHTAIMSYTGHHNSYNMTYNNNKGRLDIRGGLAGTSKNEIDQSCCCEIIT